MTLLPRCAGLAGPPRGRPGRGGGGSVVAIPWCWCWWGRGVPGAAAEVPAPLKCDSTNALGPGLGRSPRGGLPRVRPGGGCSRAGRRGSPQALSWCAPGAGHGECVAGLLRLELGERLGLQLPGGGPRLPPRGPPACPPSVSMPSEFSSISWMSGGIEPGISIFSVITRSAPAGGSGSAGCYQKLALPKQHPETGTPPK